MSDPIPEHFIRSVEKVWNSEIQQEMSKLKDKTVVKNFEGNELVMTDLSKLEFREVEGRFGKTDPEEMKGAKRKVMKVDFFCPITFDRRDKDFLGSMGTPDGEGIQEMKYAWHRKVDEKLIGAALGVSYGGVEPYVTPFALPSSQKLDVQIGGGGSNTGMHPHKLIEAAQLYEDNDIPITEYETFIVLGPKEKRDLYAYVEAASNDVWAAMIAAYLKGETKKLFDFNVINSTQLPVDENDIASVVTFSRAKGLVTAPEKMEIRIDELPDQQHAKQIVAYAQYGFTRRYDQGVIEIPCDRSPD